MKKCTSVWTVVLFVFLMVGVAGVASGAQTLMRIGQSPFYQPPLTSPAELVAMVKSMPSEVKAGFTKAGRSDLYQPFMEQIGTTEIETVQFQKGSHFDWMFYKKKGTGSVRVVKDVTWGNEKPFTGFRFNIEKDGSLYTFVVPLGCGNIALMGQSDAPAAVVPAPPVQPAKAEAPKVAKAAPVVEEAPGKLRFLADVGYMHQFDPGHYLFGRVGFEYPFSEQFSVLAMVGAAAHMDGLDGTSAILADILGEFSVSSFFVDLGVGAWITDGDSDLDAEDSQLDLIAAVGARIFGEPDAFNTSVFFEVRSAADELSEIDEFGRFGLGLRFRF